MASLYTRAADRARLAKGATSKLAGTSGEQTIPAPCSIWEEALIELSRRGLVRAVSSVAAPAIGVVLREAPSASLLQRIQCAPAISRWVRRRSLPNVRATPPISCRSRR
jgi:hypothetical protein